VSAFRRTLSIDRLRDRASGRCRLLQRGASRRNRALPVRTLAWSRSLADPPGLRAQPRRPRRHRQLVMPIAGTGPAHLTRSSSSNSSTARSSRRH